MILTIFIQNWPKLHVTSITERNWLKTTMFHSKHNEPKLVPSETETKRAKSK